MIKPGQWVAHYGETPVYLNPRSIWPGGRSTTRIQIRRRHGCGSTILPMHDSQGRQDTSLDSERVYQTKSQGSLRGRPTALGRAVPPTRHQLDLSRNALQWGPKHLRPHRVRPFDPLDQT